MPDGVVQWFDTASGEGRIIRSGRRYSASAAVVEPAARVAGARVHFDIAHGTGGDEAVNVKLRRGRRVSPHQHRFGDLTGARGLDTKGSAPFASPQLGLGRELQTHPLRVVEQWAQALADGSLDELALLYAPKASLHVGGEVIVGPTKIRRFWAASPLLSAAGPLSIDGEQATIRVRWRSRDDNGDGTESHVRVAHGEIAEQWHGEVWEVVDRVADVSPIQFSASGRVSAADRAYAIDKISKVVSTLRLSVLFTSIRLDHDTNPSMEHPCAARVTLDVNGEPVRAHVSADTVPEAIDLLERRLRQRLEHVAQHRESLRHRGSDSKPGEWRHGDPGSVRSGFFDLPIDEREVVRHKTLSPAEATIDEAIFDLESMDFDFFLFNELTTGADAVVHRIGGGAYGVQFLDGANDSTGAPWVSAVVVDHTSAPKLTVAEAQGHLDLTGDLWTFFNDAESGRGRLLYRRHDGHYGLLIPNDEAISNDGP